MPSRASCARLGWLLQILSVIVLVTAQNEDCESVGSCLDCLASGCAWFSGCFPACAPDVTCIFESSNPQQDCDEYEKNQMDNAVCNSKENCTECTGTLVPSDSSRTCSWFNGCDNTCNYCASICSGFRGCEEIESCTSNTRSCTDIADCATCVAQDCAWANRQCSDECPLDTGCIFNETNAEQECQNFESVQMDNEECASKQTCNACKNTQLLSNSSQTCTWFDGNFCGGNSCERFDAPCLETSCTETCTSDMCLDCVSQGCAWTEIGQCSQECLLDIGCVFDTDTPKESCNAMEASRTDNAACVIKGNCRDCTETPLPSDSSKSCIWFEGDFCAATCSVFTGCKERLCSACYKNQPGILVLITLAAYHLLLW